jgi:hypothetical protein
VARSCLLVNSQVLLDAQIGEKGVPCQSRGDLESLRQYGSNCQVEYGTGTAIAFSLEDYLGRTCGITPRRRHLRFTISARGSSLTRPDYVTRPGWHSFSPWGDFRGPKKASSRVLLSSFCLATRTRPARVGVKIGQGNLFCLTRGRGHFRAGR